uniref:hypothetical protein n=1 Tax=Orrella sp. TaxID=1921583 RepID=UPI004047AE1E
MTLFSNLPVQDLSFFERKNSAPSKILIIYSGHLRSFSKTHLNHKRFFGLDPDYGSNVVLHTWNENFQKTKSWRGVESSSMRAGMQDDIESYLKKEINPIACQISAQYPEDKYLNNEKSAASPIDSMTYGLRFFAYSRFKSVLLASSIIKNLKLPNSFPIAIMRPDIKFENHIFIDQYIAECQSNPIYFCNYIEDSKREQAVDCVLFCRAIDLLLIADLISTTPWRLLLTKIRAKISENGQYNKTWSISR